MRRRPQPRRPRDFRIPALLLVLAVSTGASMPSQAQTLVDASLQLETWATGLTRPTQLDFVGPDELLVVEHSVGRVRHVEDGVLTPTPAYELGVFGTGILGIAIHHASPKEVFLYIEDTTEAVGNRVNRYTWNATLGVLENEQLVHQFPPGAPGSYNDAGVLIMGPTSEPGGPYLYVAAGDREGNGQLQNNPLGAPPDDAGVILRIQRDGSPAPGNPFTPYCSATTTQTCSDDGDCPGGETCAVEVAKY
jgi:glucose/arabinose dehydrogenase